MKMQVKSCVFSIDQRLFCVTRIQIFKQPVHDMELELFIMKNHPKRLSPEAYGLRHLAFAVKSVDETVKQLNDLGIETEPVRLDDYTHKKMTFFKDPDGLPLEIHE